MLCLVISANASTILLHQVVQLEYECEYLVQSNLQPVVWSIQETFIQDSVQVVVVESNQFLEVVELGKLTLELCPLSVDDCDHDILFNSIDEIVHLLSQELEFPKLLVLLFTVDLSELPRIQLFPDQR